MTLSQDSPSTDDVGRRNSARSDIEMERLSNQRRHSQSVTQAQVRIEVEANGSSDRSVRYSATLP